MLRLAGLTLLAAVALIAVPANAQRVETIGKPISAEIKISRDGEDGKDEVYLFRDLRGSVGFFYFWRTTHLDSLEWLPKIAELQKKYAGRGVRFVCVTADNKDRVESLQGDRDFSFFRYQFLNSSDLYIRLGAMSDPYVVLIDPRGVLVWRGVPDDRLEQRLADLIERSNPPLGDERWLDQRYRKAERYLNQGDYCRAYTVARDLARMTDDSHSIHSKARALMASCEEAARKGLSAALDAERAHDLEKAARIVAEVSVRFAKDEEDDDNDRNRGGHGGQGNREEDEQDVSRRAEMMIGRMNGDRELKPMIREARKNAEAEVFIDSAKDYEDDEHYVEAKRIYEHVLKEFEDTDAAKEAKSLLDRILDNRTIRAKMAERRARDEAFRSLDIGERFAAIKMYDEARERFERVIAEHADTLAAKRAKELLAELPKPKTASATEAKASGTTRNP